MNASSRFVQIGFGLAIAAQLLFSARTVAAAPSATPEATNNPSPAESLAPSATSCANQNVPDAYTLLTLGGTYDQRTRSFTADLNASSWSSVVYAHDLSTPPAATARHPAATSAPAAHPAPRAVYSWPGVYTVTGGLHPTVNGCIAIVTTQDGKSFPLSHVNATGVGYPQIATKVKIHVLETGHIREFKLRADGNGGSGTFTLDDGATGTITLGARSSS